MFCLLATVLVAAAAMMMFSAFMFYDDEGYVLISLRNFAENGRLYGEVYSQYGPFPYVLYYLLHLAGFPFTHTAGRLLTLAAWSGSAVAAASLVWRGTRSQAARLAVLAATFVYLWIMVSEPTHPGGLIAIVTAVMAYWGHRGISGDRTRSWARLAGAGAAVLLLTKINVGGFAALSAVAWFLIHHENAAIRRHSPAVLAAGVLALPFALMRPLLAADWVQTYAILFACSGIAAVGAVSLAGSPRTNSRTLLTGVTWAAGAGAAVLAVVFARGTTVADVLEGVLLRPIRHPVHFNLSFPWPAGVRETAVASLGLFTAAWVARRRGSARVDDFVAILRVVAALSLAVLIARFPLSSPDNPLLAFGMPWLWLFLWPLAGEDATRVAARSWVGLLFLGQCLHAFPVRGSQTAWGTFLAIPVVALGAWPAAQWLAARYPRSFLRNRMVAVTAQIAVLGFAVTASRGLIEVGNRYYEGRDLRLPGAERLRLPESASALFQLLTVNAAAHGDVLFSLPGMFSFNLWSGVPTPTLANVTHWFSLLETEQQLAAIRSLEAHPRACLIVHREHVAFITKLGFAPAGQLNDYLRDHFTPAFTLDDFEFCVRKDRKILPLLLGEMFIRPKESAADPALSKDTLLKMAVLLPPGAQVETVELVLINAPQIPPLLLSKLNARVEITPVNLSGDAIGAPESPPWPFSLNTPAIVSVYFDRKDFPFVPKQTLAVLRDGKGTELALIRVRP